MLQTTDRTVRKLRRRLMRRLRRSQSERYWQRLLLSDVRRAIDPLVLGTLIRELVDADLVQVAAAIGKLDAELQKAMSAIAREED